MDIPNESAVWSRPVLVWVLLTQFVMPRRSDRPQDISGSLWIVTQSNSTCMASLNPVVVRLVGQVISMSG